MPLLPFKNDNDDDADDVNDRQTVDLELTHWLSDSHSQEDHVQEEEKATAWVCF